MSKDERATGCRNRALCEKKPRRGDTPVHTLSASDIEKLPGTFDEQAAAIAENVYDTFIYNLEVFRRKLNITQVELCKKWGEESPGTTQLSGYKRKGQRDGENPIPFFSMCRVAAGLNIPLYELCFLPQDRAEIEKAADVHPPEELWKYFGTYVMAYFDNSAALGKNTRTTPQSLRYGMLTISKGQPKDIPAHAIFNCSADEIYDAYTTLKGMIGDREATLEAEDIRAFYAAVVKERLRTEGRADEEACYRKMYTGHFVLTDNAGDITLLQRRGTDIAHIVIRNSAKESSAGKVYQSGLGSMVSVSRGIEHMPCCQAVVLSRKWTEWYNEESIARELYMDSPKIDLREAVSSIVKMVHALYTQSDNGSILTELSEDAKEQCLVSFTEKLLVDIFYRNKASYYKVSKDMDANTYHVLQKLMAEKEENE